MTDQLHEQLTSANPEHLESAMVALWRMLTPSIDDLVDALLPANNFGDEAKTLKKEIICSLFENRARLAAAPDLRRAAVDLSVNEIGWYFFHRDMFDETGWGEG